MFVNCVHAKNDDGRNCSNLIETEFKEVAEIDKDMIFQIAEFAEIAMIARIAEISNVARSSKMSEVPEIAKFVAIVDITNIAGRDIRQRMPAEVADIAENDLRRLPILPRLQGCRPI